MLLLKCVKNHVIRRSFSMSVGPYISTSVQNGIANIIMCDKQTRNSLSINMMEELIININNYGKSRDIRVIVIGAEGPVFSAGHNLKELSPQFGQPQQIKIFNLASQLMTEIIDSPVPIIAKIDGVAAAAGCQLVAQCDLAFCSPSSTFSTPGASFGIFCSTPGVALARSVPKKTSLQMLLTGLPISSSEAEAKGLVTKVSSDLEEDIQVICDAIMSKSRNVIELGKKFYYKQINTEIKEAYRSGGETMVRNLQLEDGQEGIRSFIEKRKPVWKHGA